MKLLYLIFSKNRRLFSAILLLLFLSLVVSLIIGSLYADLALEAQNLPISILLTLYIGSVLTMTFGITPTTLVSFVSGFILGWPSVVPVVSAYMLASILGFLLAKRLDNGNFLESISQEHNLTKFYESIEKRPFATVFFSKISPVLPFAVSNLLLSALKVRLPIFLAGSLLGMLPRTCLAIWTGVQLHEFFVLGKTSSISTWAISILLLISIVGFYYIFKKRNPTKKSGF